MDTFFKYTTPKFLVGILLLCACVTWGAVDAWNSLVNVSISPDAEFDAIEQAGLTVVDRFRFNRAMVLGFVAAAVLVYVFILAQDWWLSRKTKDNEAKP